MGKRSVEQLLPIAYRVLSTGKLVDGSGKIDRSLRSQISAFGAAITTGSLQAAVAFYSEQGNAKSPRQLLLDTIHQVLKEANYIPADSADLKALVLGCADETELREQIVDAAVAVKLAMNFFTLERVEAQRGDEA